MPDPEYRTSIRQAEIRDDFKSGRRYREWLAKVKPEIARWNTPERQPAQRMFAADEAQECSREFWERCARMGINLPNPQPDLKSLIPRIAAALAKCPAPDFRSPYESVRFLVEPEDDVRTWNADPFAPPSVYEAKLKSMVIEGRQYHCWYGEFHGVKLFGPMFPA